LGSVKDRIGLSMIEAAEKAGSITPGVTTNRGTKPAANTGIALAPGGCGRAAGYKVPPDDARRQMSIERP